MKIPWDEMGWDGMTFKSHGMGWDETVLKLVPWDAMGRFLNRWDEMGRLLNFMGWDGIGLMKKICPMGRISRPIPSHSEL